MFSETQLLTLITIIIVFVIIAALVWISINYTRKKPENPLMIKIQQDIIQQLARESDIRKTGKWRESSEKDLVLLNPNSSRVMNAARMKKFNPQKHPFPSAFPELVPLTDYLHQDLVWAVVYGKKKKGRRYDLRPYTGGNPAAIIEIYDDEPEAGFCALFDERLYHVRHDNITSVNDEKIMCQISDTPESTVITTTEGDTYHLQFGDGIYLTEEPEKLKPDIVTDSSGCPILELQYNYLIRILSQMDEETLSLLIMALYYRKRGSFA